MPLFFVIAAVMLIAALAFIVTPLLRSLNPVADIEIQDSNVALFRQQRDEIEHEFAAGAINASERQDALRELTRRVGAEVVQDAASPTEFRNVSHPKSLAFMLSGFVVMLSVGLYLWLGAPLAIGNTVPQSQIAAAVDADGITDKQIVALVDKLSKKMKTNPDDVQGWILLAHSQNALRHFPQAVAAYEKAVSLVPGDAQLLADYADALAMTQERKLEGKPFTLIQKALKLDGNNKKALVLAGTRELAQRHLPEAMAYWQRLQKLLPADSDDFRQVQSAIDQIHQQLASSKVAANGTQARAAAVGVKGSVAIDPALAVKVTLSDTVFVLARAANWQNGGPRMPLAVMRFAARELPREFELNDAMAMAPDMKLSAFDAIVIEARVAKNGDARPQPGDLLGSSEVVKPGSARVNIVINHVRD